jgi:hypothetical protein
MQIKRVILSVFFLSVYSIILAHNIIPHDHLPHYTSCPNNCDTHNEIVNRGGESVFQYEVNTHHNHLHCHFSVKLVLSKILSTAGFYILSENPAIVNSGQKSKPTPGYYLIKIIPSPQLLSRLLRAPPSLL